MARINKIDQFNLGPRVMALVEDGQTTSQIAVQLTLEGFAMSQPTVSRWLKVQREKNADNATRVFADHVDKELPKDLEALESIEVQCLEWAKETIAHKVERLATWRRVFDALPDWSQKIENLPNDEKAVKTLSLSIVKQVLLWVVDDFDNQKKRIMAMRQAHAVIETKLRFAGIIDGEASGSIIIKPYDTDQISPAPSPEDSDGRRLFKIDGGAP